MCHAWNVRVAWLVVMAGCWTTDPKPRATPMPDPPPPVVREPFPLHTRWLGTYMCSQGLTQVTLTLDAKRDGSLAAVFEFGPTRDNPTIPTGSYRLRGIIREGREGTFEIVLDPDQWIAEPPGYIMVSMSATSSRRWQRLVGRINHPSCGEIDVRRADE
jgi:hypothetical protein